MNEQRKKAARVLLEVMNYRASTFLTLTYDPEHLPRNRQGVPELRRSDLVAFRRRLRRRYGDVRMLGVGEYGERTWRPHYHAVVFGLDLDQDAVEGLWTAGFVSVAPVNHHRAMYIAQYTQKKLTRRNMTGKGAEFVERSLAGREPEFTMEPQRPALGLVSLGHLEALYRTRAGTAALAERLDISNSFVYEGRTWPLDYTVQQKLRERLDVPTSAQERKAAGAVHAGCHFGPEEIERARCAEAAAHRRLRQRVKSLDADGATLRSFHAPSEKDARAAGARAAIGFSVSRRSGSASRLDATHREATAPGASPEGCAVPLREAERATRGHGGEGPPGCPWPELDKAMG